MSRREKKVWGGKPRNRLAISENKLMVTIGEVGRGMREIGDGDSEGHLL